MFKINKKQNINMVMRYQNFKDFFLQVTRDSCYNLALIQPDCKLSMSFFAKDG